MAHGRLHLYILHVYIILFQALIQKKQLIVELMDNANGSPQAQWVGVVWVEFVTIPIIYFRSLQRNADTEDILGGGRGGTASTRYCMRKRPGLHVRAS